eukprot:2423126-Amphidinium_carterae.1
MPEISDPSSMCKRNVQASDLKVPGFARLRKHIPGIVLAFLPMRLFSATLTLKNSGCSAVVRSTSMTRVCHVCQGGASHEPVESAWGTLFSAPPHNTREKHRIEHASGSLNWRARSAQML